MSKIERNNNFKFEEQKQPMMNRYYRKQGYEYERTCGSENKLYDVKLYKNNKIITAEEKFLRKNHKQAILIETIQDIKTNDPGWLYKTKAKWIFWVMPNIWIILRRKRLLKYMKKYGSTLEKWMDVTGWGETENRYLPIETIIERKIGRIIKGKNIPEMRKILNKKKRLI